MSYNRKIKIYNRNISNNSNYIQQLEMIEMYIQRVYQM